MLPPFDKLRVSGVFKGEWGFNVRPELVEG